MKNTLEKEKVQYKIIGTHGISLKKVKEMVEEHPKISCGQNANAHPFCNSVVAVSINKGWMMLLALLEIRHIHVKATLNFGRHPRGQK